MATTDKSLAILLASYNGEKFIKDQLESLLSQTYQDFTIYIHDDGSSDGTLDAIDEVIAEKPDGAGRIVLLNGDSTGSAKANFLWMLSQVEADYYMFCDQDDVWLEDKVEQEVRLLESETDQTDGTATPICVFSDMYVVDENLEVTDQSFIATLGRSADRTAWSQIVIDNPAAGCTLLFNRCLRDKVINAGIDVDRIEMHDQLILAVAALTGRTASIKSPLVYYRQHGDNAMGAGDSESRMHKVGRNIRALLDGSFADEKRTFHKKERMLAEQLLKLDGIPDDRRQILKELSQIDRKPKLYRMNFYRKNDLTRLTGNLWMRLWV